MSNPSVGWIWFIEVRLSHQYMRILNVRVDPFFFAPISIFNFCNDFKFAQIVWENIQTRGWLDPKHVKFSSKA